MTLRAACKALADFHTPELSGTPAFALVMDALGATEEISAEDLVAMIRDMLLVRRGEAIDNRLAEERARNIASALKGVVIT